MYMKKKVGLREYRGQGRGFTGGKGERSIKLYKMKREIRKGREKIFKEF